MFKCEVHICNFECLELTRAIAATYVCDCGVIRRLMVLGFGWFRAGAKAFRGGAEGVERCCVGGFVMWL